MHADTLPQPARFALNGAGAACVHFAVLALCLHGLHLPSAGTSNFVAAACGMTASFFGNRHFVFHATGEALLPQFRRFWLLYIGLAFMQGLILFLWSDLAGLDYRIGFVLGVALQTICTYFGGRHWVFKPQN